MRMLFTQGISFPRSGHELLVRALAKYYSRNVTFESSAGWFIAGRFGYCEHYGHCQTVPCAKKETTFSKNHDFALDLPIDTRRRYFVQWRHPLPAIISYYRLNLVHGKIKEDSSDSWIQFYPGKLDYWRHFHRKWVRPKWPNALVFRYEEFISHPHETLCETLRFIDPLQRVEEEMLAKVIVALSVFSRDTVSTFSHLTDAQSEEFDEAYRYEAGAGGPG